MNNMNKFNEIYKKIIMEMNQINDRTTLESENDEFYTITFIYQDGFPYSDESWEIMDEFSSSDLDEMKLKDGSILTFNGRLPNGTSFDKFFKEYGGKCIEGPAGLSEYGEYQYKYEFPKISKNKLYEMMMSNAQPEYDEGNNLELLTNFRNDAKELQSRAAASPDGMIKALQDVYNNEGDNIDQEYIIKFEKL
jgi:hypothetical protein